MEDCFRATFTFTYATQWRQGYDTRSLKAPMGRRIFHLQIGFVMIPGTRSFEQRSLRALGVSVIERQFFNAGMLTCARVIMARAF